MDWTFAYVIAGVGLNALLLGFWKPWLGAYGGEKGKNLARKEDLDAILAEVRAVTIAQKEIEAKLTGEQWDRQMRWNEKKGLYTDLLKLITKFKDSLIAYNSSANYTQLPGHSDAVQAFVETRIAQATVVLSECQSDIMRLFTIAKIFANQECQQALRIYLGKANIAANLTPDGIKIELQNLTNLSVQLVYSAKKDLGLPDATQT